MFRPHGAGMHHVVSGSSGGFSDIDEAGFLPQDIDAAQEAFVFVPSGADDALELPRTTPRNTSTTTTTWPLEPRTRPGCSFGREWLPDGTPGRR